MKHLLIIFSLLSLNLYAKKGDSKWFTIGVRATAAAPFLINPNEYKDNGVKHNFVFGGGGGVMLGFHFNEWGSINVEGLYSMYGRKLTSSIDSLNWSTSTSLAYLEIPIIFRGEWNFKYIEGGVVIGSLLGATGNYTNDKTTASNFSGKDQKDNVNKGNASLLFGWGANLMGDGGLMLSLGVRMCYGLSDIVSDLGGKGKNYQPSDGSATIGYLPTNTAYVGIHFSLDFDLGYFVSSSCGRKHEFQLFGH